MKRNIPRFFLILAVVTVITCGCTWCNASSITQQYDSNKTLSVVIDNNYPPYSFQDSDGSLQGISIDEWKLWEEKTGIHVNITGLSWLDAQNRMLNGEFDVIDTIFYNDERAKIYDFSSPYAKIDVPIFYNRNISGISGPSTVRGFVIGVKSGDNVISVLKKAGITQIQEYDNYEDIIKAAADGRIMVFSVDKPPSVYFLYKYGLFDQFRQTPPMYTGEFHRAVKKGDTTHLNSINNGFGRISSEEIKEIEERWSGISIISKENVSDLITVTGIAILLILILGGWNYLLQRKVSEKTLELQNEVEISNRRANALAENEKFLTTLIDNIPDLIFVKDAKEFRYVRVNKPAEQFFGHSQQEFFDHSDYDFFKTEESDFFRSKDKELVSTGMMLDIPEEIIHTKDGTVHILHTKKIPIFDEEKNPIFLLGISEDITDQKFTNDALKLARNKLKVLNSLIFCEIQNKLFSLYGYIELVTDLIEDPDNRPMIKTQEHLISDIQYLLTSSKDYQNLGQKPPLWQNVMQSLLYGVSHTGLSLFERELDLDNLEIFADPLLERVFSILGDNIVKHGKKATKFFCRYVETDGGINIVFEDNGIGIPDEIRPYLFNHMGKDGYQLGLFLVREILGITNITINETGRYGEGAQFTIFVPSENYRVKKTDDTA